MKKVVLGISVILFGIALCVLAEIGNVAFLRNDFVQLIYVLIPFLGIGLSIWGFLENK